MPEKVGAGMERSTYARRWPVEAEMLSGFIFRNDCRLQIGTAFVSPSECMAPLDQALRHHPSKIPPIPINRAAGVQNETALRRMLPVES